VTTGDDLELLKELDGAEAPKFDEAWTRNLDPSSRDIWLLATWKILVRRPVAVLRIQPTRPLEDLDQVLAAP
jgi:hypothetical protein